MTKAEMLDAEFLMTKADMAEVILAAKARQGITWEALAEKVGLSPVFVTSACLGMNSLLEDQAAAVCEALDLPESVATALQAYPHKSWDKAVPTDPLVYRLYEIVGVYGDTIKELIHEKFGDGIMSAIDYSMEIGKQEDPKGDRVTISMNGKFLPYKRF